MGPWHHKIQRYYVKHKNMCGKTKQAGLHFADRLKFSIHCPNYRKM
ncbi:hypothetical protein BRYFOR_08634 [Marvinbryantia formatexigens DSM 14469]|uniref:Uncharacterized protein n=1 Tax=Marvinbryantia formatexigens DSM 14469 TaxID=478749 RepID=C6LJ00_9FIRM|nr:hypothetical protein BRYFOR_08634 [Marvinbryantia formatexigens DSM 14469]